ncbi:acetamidase/formamidase family protein [Anaerotruncus rubiinfantis]|uniref:acetamidase/formamidase family protein n=1 Tax=Anaerotruncus rubiinfantis TaxID=1720200 RepID=UPI00082DDEAA|nr:acetamidase/formamidase family protein [Anaerotruncus rubiinfantis]
MDQMKTVPLQTRQFLFDKEAPAVLRVSPGERIRFETEDADVSLIRTENDLYQDFSVLYEKGGGTNPLSGPVYIEGAKPGDTLAVEILRIEPGYWRGEGYTAIFSGLGALQNAAGSLQPPLEPRTKICRIADGFVHFKSHDKKREIKIPTSPFIGTIGVAPKEDRCSSGKMGRDFCGNIDIPAVKAGSTVLLPVNVEGALLSLGDVHACQGDGEITGCALECQAVVEVRVNILPRGRSTCESWPQLLDETYLGVLVPLGAQNLTMAMQYGYAELARVMEKHFGFDLLDAYQLLNLVGEIRVGSEFSCLCRIALAYLTEEK